MMALDDTVPVQLPTAAARRSRANQGFATMVGISVVVHLTAIAGVVAAQTFKQAPAAPQRAIPVELVKLGKPRDPALLPRKVAPPPPPAPQGVALASKNEPAPTKRQENQKLSDNAQRLLENTTREARLDDALAKLAEAEGSPDGDDRGTTTDTTNAARAYEAAVIRAMKDSYTLPDTIAPSQRRFLLARVILFIERDGRIAKHQFIEEHQNKAFMGALENLLRTLTLPPPPKETAARYRETGIEVIFKP